MTTAPVEDITARIAAVDWEAVAADLDQQGWAVIPGLFAGPECDVIARLYAAGGAAGGGETFRSHVIMARHGFGQGEYCYFAYPLPALIQDARTAIYPRLAPIANRWNERMGAEPRFPDSHAEFLDRCHAAGQKRPTPLLLQYGAGDYNCLHQDLYGEHVFPLQVAVLLSQPREDFDGGEFVMTEQRPRMQTRPMVVPLNKGDAVVFAVNSRPHRGTRGDYRVTLRHGVSKLREGRRHTLGIIFHDAT
ncbi:prolyl 4-hydroxylase [Skermanella stibiiresistens SB22]|uniref:Prolyl 4-hydroxylase n=1 Tax=Skermanella stibiiresistens SB22 TaxID=1385369 RepID=W9H0Y2_9PROT|nr:2OG-Fe(II) oxygenase [Skermanella stibiiresistens]EWY37413.1 prolyl 4-hydroxylase [Skermanella stibiiresistens SB22]